MTKDLRLIVFDIDGTLLDSLATIIHAVTWACERNNCPVPTEDQIRSGVGLSLEEAFARFIPEADDAFLARLAADFLTAVKRRDDGGQPPPLYDGTKALLSALNQDHILLGLATGGGHRAVNAFIGNNGLENIFIVQRTADDCAGKPAPDMLLESMAECGIDADQTVMIGDTHFDMRMAKAAGTKAIGVTWGSHSAAALTEAGADIVVSTFAELEEALLP